MPEITESKSLKQHKRLERIINQSMHLCLTISILISGLFTVFADELGQIIYSSSEVGFYIKVLSPLIPFMYIESIVDGILKGLGQQVSTLKYSVIDSCIRIALILLLLPFTGIKGFLFVMIVSNCFTSILNMVRMIKVTGVKLKWSRIFIKPCIGIIISCLIAKFGVDAINNFLNMPVLIILFAGAAVATLAYMGFLYVFRCLPSIKKLRELKKA